MRRCLGSTLQNKAEFSGQQLRNSFVHFCYKSAVKLKSEFLLKAKVVLKALVMYHQKSGLSMNNCYRSKNMKKQPIRVRH